MTTTNSAGNRQPTSGNRIFTGTFCAFSSARCRRRTRISLACSRSTLGDGDAQLAGLDQGRDEGPQLRRPWSGRPAPAAPRVRRLADLHLLQRAGELGGQRPIGVARHLGERGVEAETGLHADGEHVHRVRQRQPDARLPLEARVVQQHVGQEEADGAADRRATRISRPGCVHPIEHAERGRARPARAP